MADLPITTRNPQDTDTERLLLARLLDATATKKTGTALASAARTTSTDSASIPLSGASGILLFFNVTSVSGAASLILVLRGKNPITGDFNTWIARTGSLTATGNYLLSVGPAAGVAGAGVIGYAAVASQLPDEVDVLVQHATADSCTYSVGYVTAP
jgi:hypothetical protein